MLPTLPDIPVILTIMWLVAFGPVWSIVVVTPFAILYVAARILEDRQKREYEAEMAKQASEDRVDALARLFSDRD